MAERMDFSHLETTAEKNAREQRENEARRLEQRQKQIDYGKNTLGYQNYLEAVPRHARRRNGNCYVDPMTPSIHQVCSKRSFDGQIRKWRKQLHEYDPMEEGEVPVVMSAMPTKRAANPAPADVLTVENNPRASARVLRGRQGPLPPAQQLPPQHPRTGKAAYAPSKSTGAKRSMDEAMPDADCGSEISRQSQRSRQKKSDRWADLASDASFDAWDVTEAEKKWAAEQEKSHMQLKQMAAPPPQAPPAGISIYDDCELEDYD